MENIFFEFMLNVTCGYNILSKKRLLKSVHFTNRDCIRYIYEFMMYILYEITGIIWIFLNQFELCI